MIYFLLFLLTIPNILSPKLVSIDADQNFSLFRQRIEEGKFFTSTFAMQWIDGNGNTEQQAFGTLILWKNGYLIDTENNQRVVIDSLSEVIDHEQQQYIVSNYIAEDDDFAPAKILDQNYLASFKKKNPTPNVLNWTTDDPFETFKRLRLRFNGVFPSEIEAYDQLDNRILLYLNDSSWTKPDTSSLQIRIPDHYRKIDLRNE